MAFRDLARKPRDAARRIKLGDLGSAADAPFSVRSLARAGVLKPLPPRKLARIGRALRKWGASPAAGITVSAIRRGDRVGLIDEAGELTFGELDRPLERARPRPARRRGPGRRRPSG